MIRVKALNALGEGLLFYSYDIYNQSLSSPSGFSSPDLERTGPSTFTATTVALNGDVAFRMFLENVTDYGAVIDRLTVYRAPSGTTSDMYPVVETSNLNEYLSFSSSAPPTLFRGSPLHITGNRYADNIDSGSYADTLMGEDGNDQLRGGDANDVLYGGAGTDRLWGENDDDHLFGGSGADSLWGNYGNDRLVGGTGRDSLHGGSGNDALFGYAENDRLKGWTGNDRLYGGYGGDFLDGGTGDDRLVGHGGADRFVGGLGEDRMLAGRDAGSDVFIFRRVEESTNADADRIYHFDRGTDLIDLRAIDARDHTATDNAFRWSGDARGAWSVWAVDTRYGSRVMADTDGDGRADMSIKMIGVRGLTADDFLL